jgi:hypothetical protein
MRIIVPGFWTDFKVGDQFHIETTPDDVWWEVASLEARDD